MFGVMDVITYPGLIAVEDSNGKPLHFVGEMTFKITIEGRTTTLSAGVTNEILTRQLIVGKGVLEDLNLQLYNIPDILSFCGHAEDTETIKDLHGSSPVMSVSRLRLLSHDVCEPHNCPPNAFLIPF